MLHVVQSGGILNVVQLNDVSVLPRKVDIRLPGKGMKGEFKIPWREAGLSNHLDNKVDSDQ